MSPEQCMGQQMDRRSDIYSLGCVLYHVLSGRPPFEGSNPVQMIVKHLNEPIPRLQKSANVPEKLAEIVYRCLAKEPQERYQTIDEIVSDLKAFLEGKPLSKRNKSLWKKIKNSKTRILLAAATTAILACAAVLTYGQAPRGDAETQWLSLDKKGQSLFDSGKLDDSRKTFEELMKVAEHSSDRSLRLASLNELMDINSAIGHKDEVTKLEKEITRLEDDTFVDALRKEIEIQSKEVQQHVDQDAKDKTRRLCGQVDDVAASLNEYGDSALAEEIVRKVLDLSNKVLGEVDPATIRSEVCLAKIIHDRGDYKGAIKAYEKALELQRKFAPGTTLMAKTLMFLGRAYIQTGEAQSKCEKLLEESLELNRKHFGPSSPELAWSRYQLATLYVHFNKFSDAKSELKAAIPIYERSSQHRQREISQLASCYSLLGWLSRDRALCKKSLDIFESGKLKNYTSLCESLLQLASLSLNTDPEQALFYSIRAQAIANRFTDYQKEQLLYEFSKNKAYAFRRLGKVDDAKKNYDVAYAQAQTLFGQDTEKFLEISLAKASYHLELGENDQAEALFKTAIDSLLKSEKSSIVKSKLATALYTEYSNMLKKQKMFDEERELTQNWTRLLERTKS